MNLRILKLLLIFVLVCSLIFEIEGDGDSDDVKQKGNKKRRKHLKGRGRKNRRRNKNKKKTTTTLPYETTADFTILPLEGNNHTGMKVPNIVTISPKGLNVDKSIYPTPIPVAMPYTAGIDKSNHALNSVTVPNGMKAIMDMIFSSNNKNSGFDDKSETTTSQHRTDQLTAVSILDSNKSSEKCTSQMIRASIASLVQSNKLPKGKLLPLWSEDASTTDKLNFINQTLIGVGLPPLPSCSIPNAEHTSTMLVTSTITTTPITTTEAKIKACDADAIKATIRSYALQGKLSWFTLLAIKSGSYTKKQRTAKMNETLVNAGLPPLETCLVIDETDTTTQNIVTTTLVKTAVPTTTKKKTTTATPITTATPTTTAAPTTTAPKIEKIKTTTAAPSYSITSTATTPTTTSTAHPTSVVSEHSNIVSKKETTEKTVNEEDLCDPEIMKDKIRKYAFAGKISISKLMTIKSGNYTMQQQRALINQTLVESNLPPLPFCDNQAKNDNNTTKENTLSKECNREVNITNTQEFFDMLKQMEKSNLIPINTTKKAIAGEISKEKLKELIEEAAVKSGKIPETCLNRTIDRLNPPKTLPVYKNSENQKLNQLLAIIKAGYLPPDTLERLAKGEITKQWLIANLSKNREFILSQLPEPIAILIREGKMPPEIEAAIFSGSHNKSEIVKMIVEDDNVIKSLLPQNMQDIIQDRPIPMELKLLILSGKNASEIKAEVEANEDILQQMMSPSSFFFYNLFKVKRNRDINVAMSVLTMVALVFVMTSLGCTMTIPQIAEHAKRPKGVVIALFAQFMVMPASAYGLSVAFNLETFAAITVLICGCCPGGNLSNMLAYALRGDMNLSILMTTCSSVLGLGFMPLNIYLYSKLIVPLNGGNIVPFDKIVTNILITIIPVTIGIAIRHFRPQYVTNVMRLGGFMLVSSGITIGVLAGIMLGDSFFTFFPAPVLACCAILPVAGYTLGYFLAALAGESPKCRRTICVETGCQNVQLCATVLKLAFDPIIVGVLFLMPLVYMLFQLIEAGLMVVFFRIYDRIQGHKELEEEEDSEEKKKSDIESASDDKDNIRKEENIKLLNLNQESDHSSQTKLPEEKADESDVAPTWPLEGNATPAYLDSFKNAGTEKFA